MKKSSLLFIIIVLAAATARADLRLPAIISDHAMLQAGKPVAIWGWAEPGARIAVNFVRQGSSQPEQTFTATGDADGKWVGQLPALAAGATGRLLITSDRDAPKTIDDLVVGEVWLCGGQSNMVYDIEGKLGGDPNNPEEFVQIAYNISVAKQEAAAARPPIRYFEVARKGFAQPADVEGHWVQADSTNVQNFSAVAWNFAVSLQNRLHAPVGLIVSCVGGTRVELWMSRQTLHETSVGPTVVGRYDQLLADMMPKLNAQREATLKAWIAANPTPELQSKNQGTRPGPISTATFRNFPARLYNAMICRLEPYALRGVIWYQADGNIAHPSEYGELFQALIREWRADWKEPLPFYFVEMNNMLKDKQTKPVEPNSLCLIREQQHAGLLQPGVGMVASIDVGIKNPHFPNKKPVGERLGRMALRDCYGQAVGEVNGPLYRGFRIEGSRVRLAFTAAEGLRVRGGGDLKGFAIRGSSGPWVWASGKIDGPDIVVWSDQVPAPAAVRYAWAANPVISVENAAGLPLYPFRTDTESKE